MFFVQVCRITQMLKRYSILELYFEADKIYINHPLTSM